MRRLGSKQMRVELMRPIDGDPGHARALPRSSSTTTAAARPTPTTPGAERTGISGSCATLAQAGLILRDVQTQQKSLEDIFVDLVREDA